MGHSKQTGLLAGADPCEDTGGAVTRAAVRPAESKPDRLSCKAQEMAMQTLGERPGHTQATTAGSALRRPCNFSADLHWSE